MALRITQRRPRSRLIVGTLALAAFSLSSCGSALSHTQQHAAAQPAVEELAGGRFAEAEAKAAAILDRDGRNAEARVTRAIATYVRTAQTTYAELMMMGRGRGRPDVAHFRSTLEWAERSLASIDEDLKIAARDDDFSLELCLACWRVDWNRDGNIDPRDERLLEVELDADMHELPAGDPRRRPTFHFDIGDVHWARAMIAFQRAALDVLLAFDFDDVMRAADRSGREASTIHLQQASRLPAARERILEGLDHSDRARELYLAERDDDREWVPNPRQKSHPLPLPVDEALYATWQSVVRDVRAMMRSQEGIDLAELMDLAETRRVPVRGYVDVGRLLSNPHDIVIDPVALEAFRTDPSRALRSLLGDAYVESMRRSPLLSTLARMSREIGKGEDSFARKVRYLFWLN